MADAYPNAKGRALIFPRAMCLMTAVDLLAKMYDGKDEDKRAGDRFKDFIKFALPTEIYGEDIGATIYEFRNALHHSYQMPVPKSNGKGMQRFFSLIYEVDNHKVSTDLGSKILINFPALHKACEVGFESFKKRLETTNLLSTRQGFEEMFSKYGWMSIG
ncbi:hypothetical protein AA23498_0991 [Acetobacter nitrogenifigens DSM 23921 = NBRC 105050]|uniref:Uncharacterized protein n=2 Tax=Acetobacter nitrogenifigens TaxID=285268 RepID=A0A511XB89_9PROT|nr:hypothetical protein AA23498_0991 [Acetobacter nitrogenifigens DSM 23921 = NBRC 105050]GEN60238.1 hypothetical protein ANI02nite_21220 [Acetobacter nitrogenifigens DSM 23921 = NBRC 105050]